MGHAHFQEVAPLVAMDMAVVVSTSEWYGQGVGLLVDDPMQLVAYGFS